MCGIYFCFGDSTGEEFKEFETKCMCMLKRRGPDLMGLVKDGRAKLMSTVLWLQGDEGYKQPTVTNEFAFLWNGDVFQYDGIKIPPNISDTKFIVDQLSNNKDEDKILEIVEKIQGPFACVFWDKLTNQLWFARDFFGRQSLLFFREEDRIVISSCVPGDSKYNFVEIPAQGVFKLSLQDNSDNNLVSRYNVFFPWNSYSKTFNEEQKMYFELGPMKFRISDKTLKTPVVIDFTPSDVISLNITELENSNDLFDKLLEREDISKIVDEFVVSLTEAVKLRIENQPNMCKSCIKEKQKCDHPCIGILFSGGLDSTVLAFLAAKLLKQNNDFRGLDLLNVAFSQLGGSYNVPDRLTGLQAYQEMQELLPEYPINMVCVDIPVDELQVTRKNIIQHLLYPLNTVLDDSIGCAIWFAARGQGKLSLPPGAGSGGHLEPADYTSGCRVLLTGMGIDEQLGGYSRHRGRYEKEGLSGLEEELRMELLRISERNLGRDNRIISDHGVMARFPFLDENFVSFVSCLPTMVKCDLRLPRGVGEKLVLRLAAHKLGLVKTAREPKRAVQFGSRIAKLENRKEKASDTAIRT